LGFGYAEKYYQKALAIAFTKKSISFEEQLYSQLKFQEEIVGKLFLDFLVEKKIVVELKKNNFYSKSNIEQVNEYLKTNNLKLAILINFTPNGVIYKRLLNILQ